MKVEQGASQHQLADGTLNQQTMGMLQICPQPSSDPSFYTVFLVLQAPASVTVVFFAQVQKLSFHY